MEHPTLQTGMSVKIEKRMTNSVDPDEMAPYEPSYLDLHCLNSYPFWSTELKGLKCPHIYGNLIP